MSIDINQQQEQSAESASPTGASAPPCPRLISGVIAFGALSLVAAVTLMVLDAATSTRNLAIYAAACLILTGLAGALLVTHRLLADRAEFYRRGQLDGWYRGYRMLVPDIDDPLLK